MSQSEKVKLLFLCTGNSCRSQMAEGWARHLRGDEIDPCSAGIETHGMNPHAVAVMAEAGVDITGQRSQLVDDFLDCGIEVVVTVCDHAAETCPSFPMHARVVHAPFDDPPRLAKTATTETEALDHYRRVRDDIRRYITELDVSALRTGG